MTDDEDRDPIATDADPDKHDAHYLKFRVVSHSGRNYLCNRYGWNDDTNERELYGAYESSANYAPNANLHPVTIVIDGGIDVIPLQKWILPAYYAEDYTKPPF